MAEGNESWRERCLEVVRLSVPIGTIIATTTMTAIATPERYHPLVPLVIAMFIIVVRCWTWATEKPSLYLAVTIPNQALEYDYNSATYPWRTTMRGYGYGHGGPSRPWPWLWVPLPKYQTQTQTWIPLPPPRAPDTGSAVVGVCGTIIDLWFQCLHLSLRALCQRDKRRMVF